MQEPEEQSPQPGTAPETGERSAAPDVGGASTASGAAPPHTPEQKPASFLGSAVGWAYETVYEAVSEGGCGCLMWLLTLPLALVCC